MGMNVGSSNPGFVLRGFPPTFNKVLSPISAGFRGKPIGRLAPAGAARPATTSPANGVPPVPLWQLIIQQHWSNIGIGENGKYQNPGCLFQFVLLDKGQSIVIEVVRVIPIPLIPPGRFLKVPHLMVNRPHKIADALIVIGIELQHLLENTYGLLKPALFPGSKTEAMQSSHIRPGFKYPPESALRYVLYLRFSKFKGSNLARYHVLVYISCLG